MRVSAKQIADVKAANDAVLPELDFWNYKVCKKHPLVDGRMDARSPFCADCGIPEFRRHQRVGISWLMVQPRAILADSVGTGKTIHALGLLAYLLQRGELGKALIVVRPAAAAQWVRMIEKCLRAVPFAFLEGGSPQKRRALYRKDWRIGVVSYATMLRDVPVLRSMGFTCVIFDDVDPLRHSETKVHKAACVVAEQAERVIIMHGTPLQKTLEDVFFQFKVLGLSKRLFQTYKVFDAKFMRRGLRRKLVKDKYGNVVSKLDMAVIGYRNVKEFKRKIRPFTLRRTDADIDDVSLPVVQAHPVYLDLYPEQRRRYEELRAGFLRVASEQGEKVTRTNVMAALHAGARICVGLEAVDEYEEVDLSVPNTSCKLDWLVDRISDGTFGEDKVVVFGKHIRTIEAIQARLEALDVGFVTVWGQRGDKANSESREDVLDRFYSDDSCRFLLGTTAIEQSLNLQVARHIVCVDTILNPARMEQLVGRIRRIGSSFNTVHVHYLWTARTQESGYERLLSEEQAVIDYVWDEDSVLFAGLDPARLAELIIGEE